jgi:DNA-binding MarR family transcriptional regulator
MSDVRGTRRSPDGAELAVWREYIETSDDVRRTLAAAMQETSGLSSGDHAVLLALSEAVGRALRSSELAAAIGWERSRLSHHLRRMEHRGLVHRQPVGDDARGAAVELTEDGVRAFRAASAAHLRLVREVFVDAFTPEQLETMRTLTGTLRTHLQARSATADP